jgi:hypothetical protein
VPRSRSNALNKSSPSQGITSTQNQDVEHNSCRYASKALKCISVISDLDSYAMMCKLCQSLLGHCSIDQPQIRRPKQGMRKATRKSTSPEPLEQADQRTDRRMHKRFLHTITYSRAMAGIASFRRGSNLNPLAGFRLTRGAVDDVVVSLHFTTYSKSDYHRILTTFAPSLKQSRLPEGNQNQHAANNRVRGVCKTALLRHSRLCDSPCFGQDRPASSAQPQRSGRQWQGSVSKGLRTIN